MHCIRSSRCFRRHVVRCPSTRWMSGRQQRLQQLVFQGERLGFETIRTLDMFFVVIWPIQSMFPPGAFWPVAIGGKARFELFVGTQTFHRFWAVSLNLLHPFRNVVGGRKIEQQGAHHVVRYYFLQEQLLSSMLTHIYFFILHEGMHDARAIRIVGESNTCVVGAAQLTARCKRRFLRRLQHVMCRNVAQSLKGAGIPFACVHVILNARHSVFAWHGHACTNSTGGVFECLVGLFTEVVQTWRTRIVDSKTGWDAAQSLRILAGHGSGTFGTPFRRCSRHHPVSLLWRRTCRIDA